MRTLRILYIGSSDGTSGLRLRTLIRLGHQVVHYDPLHLMMGASHLGTWNFRTGALGTSLWVTRGLARRLRGERFDIGWVDCGDLTSPSAVRLLREHCGTVLNLNMDNPYGNRDGLRWRLLLKAMPVYDLVAVPRKDYVGFAKARGARNVFRTYFGADEVEQAPRALTAEERAEYASEVVFVGTWMPERGRFMQRLLELGVPLSIWGGRWQRAPEWQVIQKAWRGREHDIPRDYSALILASKVCLGLLSEQNHDRYTTRSVEIPYLGRPFCAKRTDDHLELYKEGEEAVFWATPEECAERCKWLLEHDEERERIAAAGRARCIANGTTNEVTVRQILEAALKLRNEAPGQ